MVRKKYVVLLDTNFCAAPIKSTRITIDLLIQIVSFSVIYKSAKRHLKTRFKPD